MAAFSLTKRLQKHRSRWADPAGPLGQAVAAVGQGRRPAGSAGLQLQRRQQPGWQNAVPVPGQTCRSGKRLMSDSVAADGCPAGPWSARRLPETAAALGALGELWWLAF